MTHHDDGRGRRKREDEDRRPPRMADVGTPSGTFRARGASYGTDTYAADGWLGRGVLPWVLVLALVAGGIFLSGTVGVLRSSMAAGSEETLTLICRYQAITGRFSRTHVLAPDAWETGCPWFATRPDDA